MKRTTRRRRMNRRGFTLIECIVSIAIFAIMATMFATFMLQSVRVVNLSIVNERDREALLEAIATARAQESGSTAVGTKNGTVVIDTVDDQGKKLQLHIKFEGDGSNVAILNNKYITYTALNGTKYCIYIGNVDIENLDKDPNKKGNEGGDIDVP